MQKDDQRFMQRLPGLSVGILVVLLIAVSIGAVTRYSARAKPKPLPSSVAVADPVTISPTISPIVTPVPSPTVTLVASTNFALQDDQRIPILMYHYIRDYSNANDKVGTNLSVSPKRLGEQLVTLKSAGYSAITFNELASGVLPDKPVVITFDDGYADAATAALPVLQEQGMKGVFYLVSGFLNRPGYLADQQVKDLVAAGMEIGAHTLVHHDLTKMNPAMQQQELAGSKAALEQLIGKPVLDLCYPSGRYNEITQQLSKSVGYRSATTTNPGVASGVDFENRPYELPRIRMSEGTDLLKMLGEKR